MTATTEGITTEDALWKERQRLTAALQEVDEAQRELRTAAPTPLVDLVCAYGPCSAAFTAPNRKTRYCSKACQRRAWYLAERAKKPQRRCGVCGVTLKGRPGPRSPMCPECRRGNDDGHGNYSLGNDEHAQKERARKLLQPCRVACARCGWAAEATGETAAEVFRAHACAVDRVSMQPAAVG